MVGTGKHNAACAVFTCSFIQVVDANDVDRQNFVKGALNGDTAQMDDTVDAFQQFVDRLGVLKGGGHHFFAGSSST